MLFKMSLKNIRRSIRDYAIYFFTLVIGVAIFYVFNSIGSQTVFLNLSNTSKDIIELLINMLSGVSVFVSVVLGLLIVYASRYLMKRRHKEFALYFMLGMGKGSVSIMILIETILIGLVSLGTGILIGIGLSQLMSAFTADLFEADMTNFKFIVSGDAIIKTIIYFGVIYIAVMFFNGIMIGRCRLIDLIQSGKKSEKIKLKNPVLCILIFLGAAVMLGFAYYKVAWKAPSLSSNKLFLMIAIGSVSTLLIYWSVSGMLLRIIMSMKNLYYNGLNSFTFRQISSKVNTMVMSMAVICLMLFVTICTFTSAFSMRSSLNKNIQELCPADIEIKAPFDIVQVIEEEDANFLDNFSSYEITHYYEDLSLDENTFFGDHVEEVFGEGISAASNMMSIYKLSEYNNLMKLYDRKQISLNENEFVYVCNYKEFTELVNVTLNDMETIKIFGKELRPKYRQYTDGFVNIGSQPINAGLLVVPDSVVGDKEPLYEAFTAKYKAESKEEKHETDSRIEPVLQSISAKINEYYEEHDGNGRLYKESDGYTTYHDFDYIGYNTRSDIADSSVGLSAMGLFIGLYLGLVFLISSGAVLALKSLSDSVDSIQRYEMLRKIGAEEKDISKSVFRQTGIFFLMPLILAIIHSIFGMKFAAKYILGIFGTDNLYQSIFTTSVLIMLIYGGYFLITYFCSKSIVGRKTGKK